MAYLNVRERRIETTIAYVGSALAGKATNLRHLKTDASRGRSTELPSVEGDTLSLEWTPIGLSRFNDCDVAVKIIAARGSISTRHLDDFFDSVDGVVVVIDAGPDAREEGRRTLALVREALAGDASRPVVVQLNKSDVEGAVQPTELDTLDWPIVTASAASGDGVYETLEMALGRVLDAMATKEPAIETKADHNPLLTALRQILRETVTDHMATLEAEAMSRVSAAVATTMTAWLEAHSPSAALSARLDQTERVILDLRDAVGAASLHTDAELAQIASTIRDLEERLSALQAGLKGVATGKELTGVEARLQADAAERGRLDREHVTAIGAVVKSATDALGVDLRKQDSRELLSKIAGELTGLSTKTSELRVVHRDLRDAFAPKLARIDESVQSLQTMTGESFGRADATVAEIRGGLTELLDELKKRKKGWFS